jgi:hypothetical protein
VKSILLSALMLATFVAALLAPDAASAEACVYDACTATVCSTSGTQSAINWPCDDPQTIACDAPACPSCTYGACDATACGTGGHRFPTNSPCTGPPSLICSAPACPACTYFSCTAIVCGTTGTQTATNPPCVGPLTISCSALACPGCVYGPCSATACGTTGSQSALSQPCTGVTSRSCDAPACPTAFYLRSTVGAPWGSSSNELAMDAAFGAGGWVDARYETVDPGLLFSAESFIFMEGSDGNADEMEAFVDAYLDEINAFLNAGGAIFFNAAPNEGNGMLLPDGIGQSIQLSYPALSSSASTPIPAHPIFDGPFTTATSFTGNSFSHATISGGGLISLLDGTSGVVLAQRFVGAGLALYGGMTVTDFQAPHPDAENLRANIIRYADAIASPEPSFATGLLAGLVVLSLCAAQRRAR